MIDVKLSNSFLSVQHKNINISIQLSLPDSHLFVKEIYEEYMDILTVRDKLIFKACLSSNFARKKYLNKRKRVKKKDSKEAYKTYIIKDSITGFYKIGRSKDPKIRERTLQSERPVINIIKVFETDIEKILHNKYKEYRVRGEWFELSNIQIKYICKHY